MWLIWRERNTRPFENVERSFDLLKFLLIGTLFEWSHILGFTQFVSIFYFLQLALVSFWFVCNCFKYNLFIIVNKMYLFLIKLSITYQKKKKKMVSLCKLTWRSTSHAWHMVCYSWRFWAINLCPGIMQKSKGEERECELCNIQIDTKLWQPLRIMHFWPDCRLFFKIYKLKIFFFFM